MRQHGHGRAEPHCRHSGRSGNPEPIQCANAVTAAPNLSPAILAAAGIQSPYHVPTRSLPHRTPLPSMPPQRESRTLTMRQHRHGRAEPHSRHSRRSGNPEPLQCTNTAMAAPNSTAVNADAAGSIGDSVTELPASRSGPPGRNVGVGRFSRGGGLDT